MARDLENLVIESIMHDLCYIPSKIEAPKKGENLPRALFGGRGGRDIRTGSS